MSLFSSAIGGTIKGCESFLGKNSRENNNEMIWIGINKNGSDGLNTKVKVQLEKT